MRVRNPFLLLAAEQIDFDATFLDLFEPGVLDILQGKSDGLWSRMFVFRSSPGGGKTTLLRLFTPSSLRTLYTFRDRGNYKELYSKLKNFNVLDENGINLLGVMLSCSRNKSYAGIEDLELDTNKENDASKKKRLLFALLNCRIIISALKGIATLADLSFPDELNLIHINAPKEDISVCCPTNCSGLELFEWAQKMEEEICRIIDDLTSVGNNGKLADNTLSSLYIINPKNMLVNGSQIVKQVVVMLDDFNELTPIQRKSIMRTVISSRPPVGVWISERLEALSEKELITKDLLPGDRIGRDYEIITLENFWSKNPGKFEKVVLNVANRRIKYADYRGISSFRECISDNLEDKVWCEVLRDLSKKVEEKISGKRKYQEWLKFCKEVSNSFSNMAITWRALEILVERDKQRTLSDFDEIGMDKILTIDEFYKQCGSDVKAAAELFISEEFNLPYYFGWSRIAKISTFNIEQFIYLSSKLFEEFLSSALISTSPRPLVPKQQEKTLKKSIETRLSDIIERLPKKEMIKNFIYAIGEFAKWETYKPNAPYSPGVTGIAIEMSDLNLLTHEQYKDLALVISECIKQNLLLPVPNYKCKGKYWMVLYLNRMLCVKYGLPLQYGGWREKTLHELYVWLREGFRSKTTRRRRY